MFRNPAFLTRLYGDCTKLLMIYLQSTDANVRVWDLSDPEKHPKPTFRDISNSKVRARKRALATVVVGFMGVM